MFAICAASVSSLYYMSCAIFLNDPDCRQQCEIAPAARWNQKLALLVKSFGFASRWNKIRYPAEQDLTAKRSHSPKVNFTHPQDGSHCKNTSLAFRQKRRFLLTPRAGLEPTTLRLTARALQKSQRKRSLFRAIDLFSRSTRTVDCFLNLRNLLCLILYQDFVSLRTVHVLYCHFFSNDDINKTYRPYVVK